MLTRSKIVWATAAGMLAVALFAAGLIYRSPISAQRRSAPTATNLSAVPAGPQVNELLYATNGSSISRFSADTLGAVTTVPVTGLQGGETLVGIDLRPATGQLYGIGSTSRMYVINPTTGAATQVGAAGAFTISGTAFGDDFNPNVDRLRLVSNTEQNIRLNPNDGTLSATDTALNPAGNIVAAAYDRNDLDAATPTTLYAIDSAAGTLVTIGSPDGTPNSPNGGMVFTVGSLGLGTNLNDAIGFDISGVSGIAYATITTGGISRLYTINLATGAATLASSNGGAIGAGTTPFLGVTAASPPNPPVGSELIFATNGTSISRFLTSSLGSVTTVPVTGLQGGETLVGIDVRRSTFQIYGIGSTSRMYIINPITGAATQVGAAGAFTLNGTSFGNDFNPNVDRLRVVSNTEQNLRLNPNDGTLTSTDTALNPAGNIVAIAYDRNDLDVATPTTLYGIDSAAGTLVTIGSPDGTPNSPNGGAVFTVGSLGLGTNLNDAIGFDVSPASGIAYATITTGGLSRLYTINLTTGAATLVGTIGSGTVPFAGMTVALSPTASAVNVSGRVRTLNGRPLRGVTVLLTDSAGTRTAVTNSFGYYSFAEVPAGASYVIQASARSHTFSPRLINVADTLTDVDLIADQ